VKIAALLFFLPSLLVAQAPFALVIRESAAATDWKSAVVASGSLKLYFPESETETAISLSRDEEVALLKECLSAIQKIASEAAIAPVEKGDERFRISLRSGGLNLDIESTSGDTRFAGLLKHIESIQKKKKGA
jgi:hypothetical protein